MIVIKDLESFCQEVDSKVEELMIRLEAVEKRVITTKSLAVVNELLEEASQIKKDIARLTLSQQTAVMVFRPYQALN